MGSLLMKFQAIHVLCLVLLCLGMPAHAEFNKSVLEKVQSLHEEIILIGQRNINGADTAAMWGLFDADVLKSLNGGVVPLTVKKLNAKYNWTDIHIPLADAGEKGHMKTGTVRIEFFLLPGSQTKKPYFLAVYYHGLGVVPAATFRIFHFKDDRYSLAAAMEKTEFINTHPELQWNLIQIQIEDKGHFSSYFTPPTSGKNRAQARWFYDGKKLKILYWYPEVDYHREGDKIVPGRGKYVKP